MIKKFRIIIFILLISSCGIINKLVDERPDIVTIDTISNVEKVHEVDKRLMLESPVEAEIKSPIYESSSPASARPDLKRIREKIDRDQSQIEIKSNSNRNILYKVPDTMKILSSYKVIVLIGGGQVQVSFQKQKGKLVTNTIKISETMEVALVPDDAKDFEIKQLNEKKQIVDSLNFTVWEFVVIPQKTGKKNLNLVVSIISDKGKREIVMYDEVSVVSDIKKQVTSFWDINWKWSLDSILIPIISSIISFLVARYKYKESK
jgi:hypothetical protein